MSSCKSGYCLVTGKGISFSITVWLYVTEDHVVGGRKAIVGACVRNYVACNERSVIRGGRVNMWVWQEVDVYTIRWEVVRLQCTLHSHLLAVETYSKHVSHCFSQALYSSRSVSFIRTSGSFWNLLLLRF